MAITTNGMQCKANMFTQFKNTPRFDYCSVRDSVYVRHTTICGLTTPKTPCQELKILNRMQKCNQIIYVHVFCKTYHYQPMTFPSYYEKMYTTRYIIIDTDDGTIRKNFCFLIS